MTAEGDVHVTANQTINYNQIVEEAKQSGSLINLPQTNVTFFAGRDDDLKKVHELLQKNQRVAVAAFVKGMGGVGKSELALQYALRHLKDYGGGICWLRGNEGTLPTQLQDFVQVQLGETMPDGLVSGEKLAGHCWRRLSERVKEPMLVVLDDVKDYGNVEPFLPTLDGKFRVLVTTRLGLGNAMQQYTLDVLVLAAAVDLLKSFLPEVDPRRENEEAIENLCTWLGRLPLAIELVGRYLARKPDLFIAKMQERLEAKKLQQEALTDTKRRALAEMTAKLNVIAAFDLSWQDLSEGAQRLACLLSLFALAPIHWQWVMDAMNDVDLEDYRDDELLNLHLLERTQQGVYELHQLLREYFQFQLQQHPEWQFLRKKVAVSLLNISKGIEETLSVDRVKEITPAIPHLEMLGLKLLDDIPDPENNLVLAFLGIVKFYKGKGLYDLAVIPLQNCLKATELRLGIDHLEVASSLNNLAEVYKSQEKYSKAEEIYWRSLSILERKLGGLDNLPVASILENLAGLYQSQGKYDEAEPLYMQSLAISEQQLGENHLYIAFSLNNLASLYQSKGKYNEARSLFVRSLAIREQQLGSEHTDVAISLNNLAYLYKLQGKYSEAEPLYLRSLAIREYQLGIDHHDVAVSLNNLAFLYKSQSKYNKAEPLFVRALAIREYQLGVDHPSVSSSLNNLALVYQSQGKYNNAEPLFVRALTIREKQLGAAHPDVAESLNNLAYLYQLQGKYSDAEPLYLQSLTIIEKQQGVDPLDVATRLNNLAYLYKSQRKYSEAEPLYLRSLKIVERQLRDYHYHPYIPASLSNLAELYLAQGKLSEAEPHLMKSLSIRERQLGTDHLEVAQSLNNLAELYLAQGKHNEAESIYVRSLSIRERKLGATHPDVAQSRNNLAALYKSQGKYSEAEPLYLQAIQIFEKALGSEHPNTVIVRQNYEDMRENMN